MVGLVLVTAGMANCYQDSDVREGRDDRISHLGLKEPTVAALHTVVVEPVVTGSAARYVARGRNWSTFFTDSGMAMVLTGGPDGARLALSWELVNARPVKPRAEGQLAHRVNYLVGSEDSWRINLPTWSRVVYDEVYPGIRMVVKPRPRGLEYRFHVAAGADPSVIRLKWRGATALRLGPNSQILEVDTSLGVIRETGLRAFERHQSQERDVDVAYRLDVADQQAQQLSFTLPAGSGASRRLRPLIIDPVIDWSSLLGGSDEDYLRDIAVDNSGCTYVTGYVRSTDYPTSVGALDTTQQGVYDAVVTKVHTGGSGLGYSTYLGGQSTDRASGLAVDDSGYVFVTGTTNSWDFPTTNGAFDTTYNGSEDVFVAKLDPSGSSLDYSTFIGGPEDDRSNGVAIDSMGQAFITGNTESATFPTTAGVFDTTLDVQFDEDAFVTKLDAAGASLRYSTFIGGKYHEAGRAIAIDAAGHAYIIGDTISPDYPTTAGALCPSYRGWRDAFVTKLDPLGASLSYSTYLGGSDLDFGSAIAVDATGHAYIIGQTRSADFPTTTGALDSTYNGERDAYVAKLDPFGVSLAYSLYLGGNADEYGNDIAVDSSGYAYVTGRTRSGDFPTTDPSPALSGGADAFVSKLDPAGAALSCSAFIGGTEDDAGRAIALDTAGYAYVTGSTASADFPTSTGALDTTYNGYDSFILRMSGCALPNGTVCSSGADCDSEICEDGICCAVSCGLCLSCDSSGSVCEVVPEDDADCGYIGCNDLDTPCRDYHELTQGRCQSAGECKIATTSNCTDYVDGAAETPCGSNDETECDKPDSCDGSGSCQSNHEPDGTACVNGSCESGVCSLVAGGDDGPDPTLDEGHGPAPTSDEGCSLSPSAARGGFGSAGGWLLIALVGVVARRLRRVCRRRPRPVASRSACSGGLL